MAPTRKGGRRQRCKVRGDHDGLLRQADLTATHHLPRTGQIADRGKAAPHVNQAGEGKITNKLMPMTMCTLNTVDTLAIRSAAPPRKVTMCWSPIHQLEHFGAIAGGAARRAR